MSMGDPRSWMATEAAVMCQEGSTAPQSVFMQTSRLSSARVARLSSVKSRGFSFS